MCAKLRVEILDKSGIKKRKKYPVEGDRVIIEKAKKGKPGGWKPQFNSGCFVFYKGMWPFRFLKRKLMVIDGHDHCVVWDIENQEMKPSRYKVKEHFNAEVFNKAGNVKTRLEVPILLYGFFGIVIVMQLLLLLVFTGRLRL